MALERLHSDETRKNQSRMLRIATDLVATLQHSSYCKIFFRNSNSTLILTNFLLSPL